MKKRTKKIIAGLFLTLMIVGCVYIYKSRKEKNGKHPIEQIDSISFKQMMNDFQSFYRTDRKVENGNYRMLPKEGTLLFVKDMTGMISMEEGIFTIPEMLPKNIIPYFPTDTATYIYIPECESFKNGVMAEIKSIHKVDTLFVYKFKIKDAVELLNNMTIQMDSLLNEIKAKK